MIFLSSRSLLLRAGLLVCSAGLALSVTGCGMGTLTAGNGTAISVGNATPLTGILHGGPNPVVGARVVAYATTGNGYGIGTMLQEATKVGTSAHQDTDANGNFSFAGGYTCPAGAYVYIVAYGGNSGAGNNPNSILMTALGSCSNLFTGTTYTGGTVWLDELTTVAAGYALNNFLSISGDALNGYTVGIGADATNAAATGCVANAYYTLSACPTTTAAGMAHAFQLAQNLVSTSTGQVNATTTNGAVVPAQLINTLGNILQACVNSTGGGTSPSTGLPTTTTSNATGTTHDGTVCGRLSAYTSYTTTGNPAAPLVASGNTLGFIQNLARRPTGSYSTFDSACDSNTVANAGTTKAASCIFNLVPAQTYYSLAMTAAPPDWILAIFYPKSALSSVTSNTTGCTGSPTTLGLLYPTLVATDINDDIDIVNADASTAVCYNLLSVGFDGAPIGANQFVADSSQLMSVANDSFGHTIVPVHPASTTTGGSVRIYATGTDAVITQVANFTSSQTTNPLAVATDPFYVAVDGNDNIWVNGMAGTAGQDNGSLLLSGSNSHLAPAYTSGTIGSTTGKGIEIAIDPNNNIFQATSSSSGATRPYFTPAGGSSFTEAPSANEGGGSTSNGSVEVADNQGNVWIAYTVQSSATVGSPVNDIVFKVPYTIASGTATWGTSVAYTPTTAIPASDYKLVGGVMDGNNVMWWADQQGSSAVGPPAVINFGYLHGFDTGNGAYLPTFYGCGFTYTTSTACGSQTTDTGTNAYPSNYAYPFYGVKGMAIDSAGNIWTANGTQGHLVEAVGLAAPTWPLFIHNGTSNKP